MAIESIDQTSTTLPAPAEPLFGHPLHAVSREAGLTPKTVLRHILQGVVDAAGERIRLRASKVGGRWHIRRSDLDEFVARLSERPRPGAPAEAAPAPEASRMPARRHSAERASRALDALGI